MKKIIPVLAGFCLLACFSCVDDRNNFLPDDSLGLNMDEKAVTVSVYDDYRMIGVGKSGKGFSEAQVTLGASQAALDRYNEENGTDYLMLPRSWFSLTPETFTIPSETFTRQVDLTWDSESFADHLATVPYVIPVRMESADLTVHEDRQEMLVILHRNAVGFEREESETAFKFPDDADDKRASLNLTNDLAIQRKDLVFHLEEDRSLVDAYNREKGTGYEPAPAGLISLDSPSVTMAPGETIAALSYTVHYEKMLDSDGNPVKTDGYILPVRIASTSLKGLDIRRSTAYLIVKSIVPSDGMFTRLWGYYFNGENGWAAPLVPSLDGADRSLTMDDQYVYIPQTTGDVAAIHKFDIQTGAYLGTLPTHESMDGGTHWVSCARMMPNTDPAVNGGKDFLVVSNLAQTGEPLRFFAYVNGTDQAPVMLYNVNATRRFGDKFTVWGSYQTGRFYLRSYDSQGMTAHINLSANADRTAGNWTAGIWGWLEPRPGMLPLNDVDNISEFTLYPGQDTYGLLATNSDAGLHLVSGTDEVARFPELARTFGYQFFEVDGESYLAYASLTDKSHPTVTVLKGAAGTLEDLRKTLGTSAEPAFEVPLQHREKFDVEALYGNNSVGDCCVRRIDGKLYLVALAQRSGLSMFILN